MKRFIFGIIMGILCLILFIQNAETVELKLLIWTFSMPRFILLLFVLLIGLAIGWFTSNLRHIRKDKKDK